MTLTTHHYNKQKSLAKKPGSFSFITKWDWDYSAATYSLLSISVGLLSTNRVTTTLH